MIHYLLHWRLPLVWLFLVLLGTACNPAASTLTIPATAAKAIESAAPFLQPSHTPTDPPKRTQTPAFTRTPTVTPTYGQTHVFTPPSAETTTPTYAILRGEVLVRSNCRYGPGWPYLYKYGLVPGSNLEVIGRTDEGNWILVRAIGGTNPCWVKASLMDVKGDVMSVAPTYIPLPPSPYYPPLRSVSAVRNGDEVTVSWRAVKLRAGDETASPPYLLEAWVCRNGRLVFTPLGAYENVVTIVDEAGCSELSHGRVYLAEKHGYTRPVEVPWPTTQVR